MYAIVLLTATAAPGQCYGGGGYSNGYARAYANGTNGELAPARNWYARGYGASAGYSSGGGCYGATYAARPAPPPQSRGRALSLDFEDRDSRLQLRLDRGNGNGNGPAVYESRVPERYRGRTPCEADDDDGEIEYQGPSPGARYTARAPVYRATAPAYRAPPPRYLAPAPQVREERVSFEYARRRP
jgi:hypothetical protein